MSYTKFLDDVNAHMIWCGENNIKYKNYERYLDDVRDKWIEDGRFKELISFILENWDSGNCDKFMEPLEIALVKQKEILHFKRLWKGIIRNRLEKLWNYMDSSHRKFAVAGIDRYISWLKKSGELEEVNRMLTIRESAQRMQKPKSKPTTDKRKIDERLFWELISESRSISQDQFEFLEKLKDKLESFNPTEIRKFQKIFLTKFEELNSWDLWSLAYIVRRGCGDDGFDYFKAWVISKGEIAFQNILTLNVNQITDLFDEDPQLEDFLYLAENVYESKTNEIMKPVSVKTQKMKGKEWKEEELETTYPELSKLFEYSNNRG